MTIFKPLTGVNVVEFRGIGPAPLTGWILAGMGADVTLITRPDVNVLDAQFSGAERPVERGKRCVELNLKDPEDRSKALNLVAEADVLIEGFRPGVMERIGLGPVDCSLRKPGLVYGRMTGWGQEGPLARVAGHDLNYVALSGLLSLSARRGEIPIVPPAVVGDAAGALGMAFGIVCALLESRRTGKGCVVDTAIIDIAAMLGLIAQHAQAAGQLGLPLPSPFHDSPFYDVYECADGRHVTFAAMEPQFYQLMLEKLGMTDVEVGAQYDRKQWPAIKERVRARVKQEGRDEWCRILEGTDVCFAPVLDLTEVAAHPHNAARGNFESSTSRATAYGTIAR